ncbi:hypothetical protein EON73_04640, partial [bacterium]
MEKARRKRIVMTEFDRDYLTNIKAYNPLVTIDKRDYFFSNLIPHDSQSSITWRVSDKFQNFFALTFYSFDVYNGRNFEEIMLKAMKVNGHQQFARVESGEIKTFLHNNSKIKCVIVLEEWIEGIPLQFVENERINIPFILNYIQQLCEVLSFLKHLKIRHDNLTSRNVLLVKPRPGSLKEVLNIKIIGWGGIKDYFTPLKPEQSGLDDTGNFALQIQVLLNKALYTNSEERRILGFKEMNFISESINVLNSMVESDKNRALTKPFLISQNFLTLYNNIFAPVKKSPLKLSDPFDFISAEQISDDELLVKL